MNREKTTMIVIFALLSFWTLFALPAMAVDPGQIMLVGTGDSSHGTLNKTTTTLTLKFDCSTCTVTTDPERIQLHASRDLVGVKELSGFMARDFTLSPSDFGTENEVDALIRFDLRLNGSLLAIGQKASVQVRAIASVADVTDSVRIAEGFVSSVATQGGSFPVSISTTGAGASVPVPLPKLDKVADQTLRHYIMVRLKRGHEYRLRVVFEGFVQQELAPLTGQIQSAELSFLGNNPLPIAAPGVQGGLMWEQAVVIVGDDVVELLDLLGQQIGTHDADIKEQLADLEGQITDINEKLDEVKNLLLTPQGRRSGFPRR